MSNPRPVAAQDQPVRPEKPIWAKNATVLNCRRGRASIQACDHVASVRTVCLKTAMGFLPYSLEMATADGKRRESVPCEWRRKRNRGILCRHLSAQGSRPSADGDGHERRPARHGQDLSAL